MDIADQASDREMADREFALAAQRAALSAGPSCSHCLDCGEPIPAERQEAVPAGRRLADRVALVAKCVRQLGPNYVVVLDQQ